MVVRGLVPSTGVVVNLVLRISTEGAQYAQELKSTNRVERVSLAEIGMFSANRRSGCHNRLNQRCQLELG